MYYFNKYLPNTILVLFSFAIAMQGLFLVNGDVLNHYPYLTSDSLDWIIQAKALKAYLFNNYEYLDPVGILRNPLYVILLSIDFLIHDGFLLFTIFLLAFLLKSYFAVKILKLFNSYNFFSYVLIVLIIFIYPTNRHNIYILPELMCSAFMISGSYYLLNFYLNNNINHLKISLFLFFFGSLAQVYVLCPMFLIIIFYDYKNFFSLQQIIKYFLKDRVVLIKYFASLFGLLIILKLLWLQIPHIQSSPNTFKYFPVINENNILFCLKMFTHYSIFFLVPSLFFILFKKVNFKFFSENIFLFIGTCFFLLNIFYNWPWDIRFTNFYIIWFAFFIAVKSKYLNNFMKVIIIFLVIFVSFLKPTIFKQELFSDYSDQTLWLSNNFLYNFFLNDGKKNRGLYTYYSNNEHLIFLTKHKNYQRNIYRYYFNNLINYDIDTEKVMD